MGGGVFSADGAEHSASQLPDPFGVFGGVAAEYGGACDQHVGACSDDLFGGFRVDAAVYLQINLAAGGFDHAAELGNFAELGGEEGLTAEAGVYGHDEDEV